MRFKHGHFCDFAAEPSGPAPGEAPCGLARPSFHLDLENPTVADQPSGQEQLQRLVRAHDAGETLPADALGNLIDALRVFVAHGELEAQLGEFARHAGLVAEADPVASSLPAVFERKPRPLAGNLRNGTTTLDAARNLHCRALHVQANMTRLSAALRETMGIVVRMKRATLARPLPRMLADAAGADGEAKENDTRPLANAVA